MRINSKLYNIPDVSADNPCKIGNVVPQALETAVILAITGRLWMTNDTSAFWFRARFCAWPRSPNPPTSVAAWAPYLCIKVAAKWFKIVIILAHFIYLFLMVKKYITSSIKSRHGVHCSIVCFTNFVLTYHQLDAVPSIRQIRPLVHGHCNMST